MPAAEIFPVIEAWTRIYAAHLSPENPLVNAVGVQDLAEVSDSVKSNFPRLRYMQIFENKGAAMGCSNPHPHCQIWTTSSMPEEPGLELAQMAKYRSDNSGNHLLADYVALEMEKRERVVYENDSFLVVCPWWAIWPFEVLVLPKRHIRALVDMSAEERQQFATAIQDITRRYDNLFECSFPYSRCPPLFSIHAKPQLIRLGSGIHQAPLDGSDDEIENSYFHMHFYPPLLRSATVRKFLVGYEMMAEPQRDITPEQAAARLRNCGGELYRISM